MQENQGDTMVRTQSHLVIFKLRNEILREDLLVNLVCGSMPWADCGPLKEKTKFRTESKNS